MIRSAKEELGDVSSPQTPPPHDARLGGRARLQTSQTWVTSWVWSHVHVGQQITQVGEADSVED